MTDDTDTTDEAITALVAGRNALRDAVNAAAAAARHAHDVTAFVRDVLMTFDLYVNNPRVRDTTKETRDSIDISIDNARSACVDAARVAADAARAVARVERAARRADDDGALAYMAERAASAAERATASAALASAALDRGERAYYREAR